MCRKSKDCRTLPIEKRLFEKPSRRHSVLAGLLRQPSAAPQKGSEDDDLKQGKTWMLAGNQHSIKVFSLVPNNLRGASVNATS
jgi:hypothetical protein